MNDEAPSPEAASTPPARRGRPSGTVAAKRTGRPATGRGDRIVLGSEVVASLDAMASTLAVKFGFRPTPGQVVAWMVASIDTTIAAQAVKS